MKTLSGVGDNQGSAASRGGWSWWHGWLGALPSRWREGKQRLLAAPFFSTLAQIVSAPTPDLAQQEARLRFVERDIGLPVKVILLCALTYYIYFSGWADYMTSARERALEFLPREVVQEIVQRKALGIPGSSEEEFIPRDVAVKVVQHFFILYAMVNIGVGIVLYGMHQLPFKWIPRIIFTNNLFDALFLAALIVAAGGLTGFGGILFWIFIFLIVRNAAAIPVATAQILLNLSVTFCYILAVLVDITLFELEVSALDESRRLAMDLALPNTAEPFFLRAMLLLLLTICCYGVQVLFDKQLSVEEEAREFAVRQNQLRSAGRLAAEIAHQIKNPLGIINNAAFNLQRTLKDANTGVAQQIEIIREEVERSDRIVTELMGYAQLMEGMVEKISVIDEIERTIQEIFPAGAQYETRVHRDYVQPLPPLLMQRNHLSEVLANLFLNAREAMQGRGEIWVTARAGEDYSVIVTIEDTGPGISPGQMEHIFKPYFTTKKRGTGLGLAIVKHNSELYGGTVQVESEPGNGSKFTLVFPAKTILKLRA